MLVCFINQVPRAVLLLLAQCCCSISYQVHFFRLFVTSSLAFKICCLISQLFLYILYKFFLYVSNLIYLFMIYLWSLICIKTFFLYGPAYTLPSISLCNWERYIFCWWQVESWWVDTVFESSIFLLIFWLLFISIPKKLVWNSETLNRLSDLVLWFFPFLLCVWKQLILGIHIYDCLSWWFHS